MAESFVLSTDRVSKKFCRRLRPSMYYGMYDVLRGMVGLSTHSEHLRPHEFWAVDGVSFSLRRGDRIGLVGGNGSGKSTLLRLLAGIYQPDTGRIEVRGHVSALIALGAGFHPLLTGRENIFLNGTLLGLTRREIETRFSHIVEFAGIGDSLDAPDKTYSSGMHVRLGFAIAIHASPDILLIDEILAVGDSAFQDKCTERVLALNRAGTALVFVSHSPQALERICDRGLFMKAGKLCFLGNIRECISRYFDDLGRDNAANGVAPVPVGLGQVVISKVRVYQDEVGTESSSVEFCKDFYIEFVYRFVHTSQHNNQIRVTIKTLEGRDVQKLVVQEGVFQDGQAYHNVKLIRLGQSGVVKIKVVNPRLFPQTFVVDVAIAPMDRSIHLGGLANAALFNVVHPVMGDHYLEYGNMTVTEFDYEVSHAPACTGSLARAAL